MYIFMTAHLKYMFGVILPQLSCMKAFVCIFKAFIEAILVTSFLIYFRRFLGIRF